MADYPISKEAVIRELINLRDRLGGPFAKEVLDMALTRLEGFPQMDGDNRWISVEERLPEGEVIALCYDSGVYCYGEYIVGYVSPYSEPDGVGFRAENDYELLDGVTHWMPLPEPPKKDVS